MWQRFPRGGSGRPTRCTLVPPWRGAHSAATLVSTLAQVLVHMGPFVVVFATAGWTRVLGAVASTALVLGVGVAARSAGLPSWSGLFLPLSTLAFCYVLLRSMVVTLVAGGISWRGTHSPLRALKQHRF